MGVTGEPPGRPPRPTAVDVPPPTAGFGFPQHLRLKTPAQFRAVYDLKKSAADGVLVVYAGPNDLPHPRVGLSVSKKVGNAVRRNRYKRLFREAFRLTRPRLPAGVDFILIPRNAPEPPPLDRVKESLVRLAHQAARKLPPRPKPSPPAGGPA